MKVKNLPIESVKPYERNPRRNTGAVDAVAESIKQFGWNQPIVVDKNNVIIVGHTRLKAAKKLGLKEVPVLVAENLNDEQVKKYRILDNKTNELSEWDFQLLQSEIADFNLDFSGFNIDFDSTFAGAFEGNGSADPDTDIPDELTGEDGENSVVNVQEEWTDMPEAAHDEEANGVKHIVVHFMTWKDVTDFANLIQQRITEKTSYIWFPKQEKISWTDHIYE